ncbi:MAG TPA: hypothetical protein VGD01_14750 [Candidatus Elarobacter sp.]|jgi:hypothetical protein
MTASSAKAKAHQLYVGEFSFGYALVNSIDRFFAGSALRAPYFPTQRRERTLPIDVRLVYKGLNLYLQLKRSKRFNYAHCKYRAALSGTYHGFQLEQYPSTQHNDLMDLGQKIALGQKRSLVGYCAPNFIFQSELNRYFLPPTLNALLQQTVFFPSIGCNRISDRKSHWMYWNSSITRGIQASDPVTTHPRKLADELTTALHRVSASDELHDAATGLSEVVELFPELMEIRARIGPPTADRFRDLIDDPSSGYDSEIVATMQAELLQSRSLIWIPILSEFTPHGRTEPKA